MSESPSVPRTGVPVVPRTQRITAESVRRQALADLVTGLTHWELWSRLAVHDIRQRFRRSLLGPLWLTLSMGVLIATMALVFSTLFGRNMSQTLPFIATGIIFWGLLTSCINEGTTVFTSAEAFIRNVPVPLSVHVYRMVARNVLVWVFNMVIYLLVAIAFRLPVNWSIVLFIPGFALFLLNLTWIALASGILSTRYRDIPPVIANVIQVVFYVTPIFWELDPNAGRLAEIVGFNPFYHLINIVRMPLLGEVAPPISWLYCLGMAVVGIGLTFLLYRRAHGRIAYWV